MPLGSSEMVSRQPLELLFQVRILAPQPHRTTTYSLAVGGCFLASAAEKRAEGRFKAVIRLFALGYRG
jgi:hypothetical protein